MTSFYELGKRTRTNYQVAQVGVETVALRVGIDWVAKVTLAVLAARAIAR